MSILLYLVSQYTEYILRHPHQYTCQVCIPGYQVHIKTSPPVYKHVNPVILSIPGYQVHTKTSPPVYMSILLYLVSQYTEYILLRHPHQYTYMSILLYLVSQDTKYILRHPHQYTCQVCIPSTYY